jgi:hypothetical protein
MLRCYDDNVTHVHALGCQARIGASTFQQHWYFPSPCGGSGLGSCGRKHVARVYTVGFEVDVARCGSADAQVYGKDAGRPLAGQRELLTV